MSLSTAVLRELMAAGLSGDALLAACERIEGAKPAAKSNAQRQAEWRARNAVTNNKSNVTPVTKPDTAHEHARAELEPKTLENSYLKTPLKGVKKGEVLAPVAKPKSANAECLAELGKVLDLGHAQAVLDHRNRMRKPMTPYAASRLAQSLSQASDPNAAADEMIERGWQGWKPDWGRNTTGPPRQAQNRRGLIEAIDRMIPDEPQPRFPRLAG